MKTLTWTPAASSHAIEQVLIQIQLKDPLPAKTLSKAANAIEQIAQDNGIRGKLEIESQYSTRDSAPLSSMGWQFIREENGLVLETIIIDRQNILYFTSDYSRWDNFIERYSNLLVQQITSLADISEISSLVLEYSDRFIYDGPPTHANPSEIIEEKFLATLPRCAAQGEEVWHIHRGWWEGAEQRRLLINQNVAIQERTILPTNAEQRSISIVTRTEKRSSAEAPLSSSIIPILRTMHDVSKDTLSKILMEDIRKKIGLTAS